MSSLRITNLYEYTNYSKITNLTLQTQTRCLINHLSKQIYKPDSVWNSNLSSTDVAVGVKRHFLYLIKTQDTTLHSDKDLAVSPPKLPLGFTPPRRGALFIAEKSVSARTSRITPYGRYPLPFPRRDVGDECPDFPLRLGRSYYSICFDKWLI